MARDWQGGFPVYVPMAERRAAAARAIAKLRKDGRVPEPIEGFQRRAIATTFWGRAWCQNLEGYGDYATRLPRGRSYLRGGLVVDLAVRPGQVTALVSGSDLYEVTIAIRPLERPRWQALVSQAGGEIDSVVALLEGRLPDSVLAHIIAPARGLFPAPREIRFACTCPDLAQMCKHVAAALYGVGVRLDVRPELFFVLRGVDRDELVKGASRGAAARAAAGRRGRQTVEWKRLPKLFGIDLDVKRPRRG